MADAEQPPAKRSRFDPSNGQAASTAAAPGAAPVKQVNLAIAQAAMERAKAALERKKALDAKLRASKVTSAIHNHLSHTASTDEPCHKSRRCLTAHVSADSIWQTSSSCMLVTLWHCAGPVLCIRGSCCCSLQLWCSTTAQNGRAGSFEAGRAGQRGR